MSGPSRWRDDPERAPLGVPGLLSQARASRTLPHHVHARTARNVAKIAAAPVALALGAKLAAAALAVAVVPVVVTVAPPLLQGSSAENASSKTAAFRVERASPKAPREVATSTKVRAEAPEEPAAVAPARVRAPELAAAPDEPVPLPLPPPPAPHADLLLRELVPLEDARAALATDPSRALARADDHARLFPDGQLAAERELVAIEALVRLGRTPEASARGAALSAAHPDGIYRARILALLDGKKTR